MLNRTVFASTLGLVLLSGLAVASPDDYEREELYEHRGPMPYQVLDLNKDGVVTAEEHAQVHRERQAYRAQQGYPMRHAPRGADFEAIDADGDGAISRDELSSWQGQRMSQRGMGWRR